MISNDKWLYLFKRLSKRMCFRASLYCGLAVVTALVGVVVKPVLPLGMAERFGADAVGNILSILATSMLAVTTFSLATMVSAYGMASQSATPRALPGTLAMPGRPLALVVGAIDKDGIDTLREAFSIAVACTFENDPRYGLIVLNDIAVRALSPAVSDPGTRIDVIGTVVRLFTGWSNARIDHTGPAEILYPRIHVPAVQEADVVALMRLDGDVLA